MKKRIKGFVLLGVLCVVTLTSVYCIEHNVWNLGTLLSFEKKESAKEENNRVLTTDQRLSIEVLSCEMIEDFDIEAQTTYAAEWFKDGVLPDADYIQEDIDYLAIRSESKELDDLWSRYDYSDEEANEILQRNQHIIEKHTKRYHPKTRYFFVRCKITNLLEKANDASVDVDSFIASEQGEVFAVHNDAVYFDKAIHLRGEDRDHRFFWYSFEPGEVMECTLGYEIQQERDENEVYYIGVQSPGVYDVTLQNTQLVLLRR